MTTRPAPNRERAQRQARARWAFYARLGSLRMCEGILRSIAYSYKDFAIQQYCVQATAAINDLRLDLVRVHGQDWKDVP